MPEPCGPCEGANPVVMLLTRLDTGATDRSCENDLPIMLIGQLALRLELDPQGLYDAVQKYVAKVDRDLAKASAAAEANSVEGEVSTDPPDSDLPEE